MSDVGQLACPRVYVLPTDVCPSPLPKRMTNPGKQEIGKMRDMADLVRQSLSQLTEGSSATLERLVYADSWNMPMGALLLRANWRVYIFGSSSSYLYSLVCGHAPRWRVNLSSLSALADD